MIPTTGRFYGEDPLGFEAGDTDLYRYVNNAPTTGEDPGGDAANVHRPRDFFEWVACALGPENDTHAGSSWATYARAGWLK